MRIVCAALTVYVLALPLSPASLADEPVDTVQNVIERQMDAFRHDDAKAAYAFTSPTIREKFPDEAAFLNMVKRGYPPVYRPGNYAFGRSKVSEEMVLQEVLITGSDGKDWTVIYQVLRQPDGSYKINGVYMQPLAAGSDI